jgi:hypothetical protein
MCHEIRSAQPHLPSALSLLFTQTNLSIMNIQCPACGSKFHNTKGLMTHLGMKPDCDAEVQRQVLTEVSSEENVDKGQLCGDRLAGD